MRLRDAEEEAMRLAAAEVANTPHWPDFSVEPAPRSIDILLIEGLRQENCYIAKTNTGRPGQPILYLTMWMDPALGRTKLREEVKLAYEAEYARVHPHGCGSLAPPAT